MLSENDIKKAFLPFLKEFYRYRYEYRPDSIHTELDSVSAGGLIADGMVSFKKEDGTPFLCTYEATSVDKAGEVKFTLNTLYFAWDCLAFGALTAAFAYGIAYKTQVTWLVLLGWTGNLGFIMGMGITGFLLWYLTMRGWRKYRYIYAVEQFKRYFANEQWIALAEDVFPSPMDPYLLELKSQCVYNGFGLALVPEKGEVRVLATPSRLGLYGKDRQMVQWVTNTQLFQSMSQNVSTIVRYRPELPSDAQKAWNKLWQPVRYYFFGPLAKAFRRFLGESGGTSDKAFRRYMRGQGVQKWIFLMALGAILFLAFRVSRVREDDVRDVVQLPETNPEDQYGYYYEGERPEVRSSRGIPKQYPESASAPAVESDIPTINLSGDDDQEEVPTINLTGTNDEPETPRQDPCLGFEDLLPWVIQDNVFSTRTLAEERISALRQKGVEGHLLPNGCVETNATGFLVYLGKSALTERTANTQAENFTNALERYGLLQGKLRVRRIK